MTPRTWSLAGTGLVLVALALVYATVLDPSPTSSSPGEPVVIPAQEQPAGILRTLDEGPVLGGRPTMPAQRRLTRPTSLRVETIARDRTVPWAMEFTHNDRTLYFTQRPGSLWKLPLESPDGPTRLLRRSEVLQWGEGGLMGLALDPNFEKNGWIYVSETYGHTWNAHNRIVRLRRNPRTGSYQTEVLIDEIPAASYHNGSCLEFGPDGFLYATTGDAGKPPRAQRLSSWGGKILRLTREGKPAPDNPFQGDGATPYVYSYGHRNPQGLVWDPRSGDLYASEHGPSGEFGLGGNDEINRIIKGGNYGWPRAIGAPGLEEYRDPVLLFPDPHLPPAGMSFYSRKEPPRWSNSLVVGSLRGELLLRVRLDRSGEPQEIDRVFEEDFFQGVWGRIRAVERSPDGTLFFATSNRDGRGTPAPSDDRIFRLAPITEPSAPQQH